MEIFKRGISLREFLPAFLNLCPHLGEDIWSPSLRELCVTNVSVETLGFDWTTGIEFPVPIPKMTRYARASLPQEWGNWLSGNPPRFVSSPRLFKESAVSKRSLVYEQQRFNDIRRLGIDSYRRWTLGEKFPTRWTEETRERDANIGEGEGKLSSFEISIVKWNGEAILEALIEF